MYIVGDVGVSCGSRGYLAYDQRDGVGRGLEASYCVLVRHALKVHVTSLKRGGLTVISNDTARSEGGGDDVLFLASRMQTNSH